MRGNKSTLQFRNNQLVGLGNAQAKVIFHLENAPLLPTSELEQITTDEIVAINGNHWRKIFTIAAKLTCKAHPWKAFRDEKLLAHTYFSFLPLAPSEKSRIHIVCGKQYAQTLGLSPEHDITNKFELLETSKPVWRLKDKDLELVILTPYLDYRQFPNQLISELRLLFALHGG
ncbi:hypothetical protein [Psychrobium sp. 1_MG-2023]|uniref:DUF6942 family protein n=1 Tax=Psychrobium sp. 1_MG-2023 TaxID=3062624 RepID=UPI000C335205|nr:hypothetical protein [Psychrobium sp. 1_MG-2023]MDP2562228.1 hypothetical protein [Psychrobium sp. 1_MG-2023]PKF57482.1 hypothetical protein CW748_06200 [Alteromonadales bacterium alter-6D02]